MKTWIVRYSPKGRCGPVLDRWIEAPDANAALAQFLAWRTDKKPVDIRVMAQVTPVAQAV